VSGIASIPTLATERLVMRGFTQADFPAYAAMMADPETTRHLGDGRALSAADAWRQMAMFAGHWVLRGFGVWAVEERATGAFVGRVGCMEPHGYPDFELAYTIARPFWGRGYASEAARAALAYARGELRRDRVISIIRPANARSIRVAEGLGAVREGAVEFFGAPADVYAYPPPTR
jgi:RimJ/RimL family protein N-acetyltransferase